VTSLCSNGKDRQDTARLFAPARIKQAALKMRLIQDYTQATQSVDTAGKDVQHASVP
jgi:hypothetical protein